MKIVLILPFGNESNTNYPPLGLLYLASYLRKNSSHQVRIVDLRLKRTPVEEKLDEIRQWSPDAVGVTGMSIEWSGIKHVLGSLREALGSKVTLISGGPHATCFPDLVFARTPADFVVRGEGEKPLLNLLNALESGGDRNQVNGISFRKNGDIIHNPPGEVVENPDEIPFPAYDLLNVEEYFVNPHFHSNLNKHKRVLPMFTSRGCPYRCAFCFHPMGFKFRPRSASNVLDEMDWLVSKYGVRELHIEDDAFNINMDRAKEIMRGVPQRGLKLSFLFPSGIRGDIVDQELADLFKKAGVFRINFGVESASPRIQKLINKSLDFDKLERGIKLIDQKGISTHGFFMMGFPTETEEEVMETINYAAKSRLATANFSILKMFPGTQISKEYSTETPDFDDDDCFSYDTVTENKSMMSDDRLKELQKLAMTRFFFRPARIWRIFRTTPNKKNLFTRNLFNVLDLIFKGKTKY